MDPPAPSRHRRHYLVNTEVRLDRVVNSSGKTRSIRHHSSLTTPSLTHLTYVTFADDASKYFTLVSVIVYITISRRRTQPNRRQATSPRKSVATQPISEVGQSPGPPRSGPRVFVNVFFFCWNTAVTAQKILTYWFCDNFKDTASNAIMYSVILMLVCFLFVCFCNFAIYLLCVLITRSLAIFTW